MKTVPLVLFMILSITCFSQIKSPFSIKWEKTYGGSSMDNIYDVISTSDDGYLLGGTTRSNDGDIKSGIHDTPYGDIWLVKIDNLGNIQWERTYGGDNIEELYSLQSTIDGGYIFGGVTGSNNGDVKSGYHGGLYDMWVVKLDAFGNIQWERTYGGSRNDMLFSILILPDGYLLGGDTDSNSGDIKSGIKGKDDNWVVKIDKLGNIQWEKTYGGTEEEDLYSLQSTIDGGYVLGGYTKSNNGDVKSGNHGNYDFWIVKIDNLGKILWEKTYGGSSFDFFDELIPTSDGGYLLGGDTKSNDGDIQSSYHGGGDIWVVKIDNSGKIQWEKTYGGTDIEDLLNLIPTSDGGFLLGGYTWSNDMDVTSGNKGKGDSWIVKIDSTGKIQWEQTYGGIDIEWFTSLLTTKDNGYLLCGTISYDIDFNSPINDSSNFWVIKIVPESSIIESNLPSIILNGVVEIYPNPTNDILTIETSYKNPLKLVMYDGIGNQIIEKDITENKNVINLNKITSGVYFLKLMDDNKLVHQQKILKY